MASMAIRNLSAIGAALLFAGCSSLALGQAEGARAVGRAACVPASRTSGPIPAGAAPGCRSLEPEAPAWQSAWDLHMCGPWIRRTVTPRRQTAARGWIGRTVTFQRHARALGRL